MATDFVPLNPVDQLILLTDQELRRRGRPGFTCQIHVWFRGRLNLAELQGAIASLATRWPLLTARLTARQGGGWQLSGDAICLLREVPMPIDGEEQLAAAAAKLLGEPFDITREAPVRFVVQHGANGNDVLTMQYSHVLMDGHGAIGLMNALLDGSTTEASESLSDAAEPSPRSWRQQWRQWRERRRQSHTVPLTFPRDARRPLGNGLLLRWVEADAHCRLRARIARAGMTANLSLAMVASGFRAMARQLRERVGPQTVLETALRYNTRIHPARPNYFGNHYGRVTLTARPDELEDRDVLIRQLAVQFRQQFHAENREAFLRGAQMAGQIARWVPRLNRWLLRRTVTLTTGVFGPIGTRGQTAFGAIVEGGFLHPMPFLQSHVVVDVFPVGERLLASLTYCTAAVTDEEARRLFDDWLNDLTAA